MSGERNECIRSTCGHTKESHYENVFGDRERAACMVRWCTCPSYVPPKGAKDVGDVAKR